MSTKWVKESKSDLESVQRLRMYLYDGNGNDELIDIYEQVTNEVEEIEEELYKEKYEDKEDFEGQYNDIRKDIELLIKNFKKLKRDEILNELERVLF